MILINTTSINVSAIIRLYPRRYKLVFNLKQIKGMIMSRILPVEQNKTDPATAKTLDAVKAKLGMLPNIFTILLYHRLH